MYLGFSRSAPSYPPSAAWYNGVPCESFGPQTVSTNTLQSIQQGSGLGGGQSYPSPPQGCGSGPVVNPKIECISGSLMETLNDACELDSV